MDLPSGSRRRWPVALAPVVIGLLPLTAAAQTALSGRVVEAESGAPVPMALVSLPDLRRQVFTTEAGTFEIRELPSGPHRVVVEQVARVSVDTILAGGEAHVVRLRPLVIALEEIRASATPGECRTRGFSDPALAPATAQLLGEVRKNAERHRLLLLRNVIEARVERTRRTLRADRTPAQLRVDTLTRTSREMTRDYAAGGVLVNEAPGGEPPRWAMHMPSAFSLSQPEFQEHHCFRYAGVETVDGRRLHRVDFVPTADVNGPDVAGALFLDAGTHVLWRAEFRVTGLPRGLNFEAVRVVVDYRELRPGIVFPWAVSSSQRLLRARIDGAPVHFLTQQETIVSTRILDAAPGVQPDPGTSRDHSPSP